MKIQVARLEMENQFPLWIREIKNAADKVGSSGGYTRATEIAYSVRGDVSFALYKMGLQLWVCLGIK